MKTITLRSLYLLTVRAIFLVLTILISSVKVQAQGPLCNAEFNHYAISNPDSVHFYPTGGSALTYSWNFGDGTTSALQYPWHEYAAFGTYYVCLTVTNSDSTGTCTDTWCDSVFVGNAPPVCNAEFTYYAASNPDSVHFYPSSTSANTYSWDFGDGNTSTVIDPWHFYASNGTYYVCLTVTDSNPAGTCTDTWCDSVYAVNTPPVCNAEFSHYAASNPDSVHFYPQSTSANTYSWDFGDGTTSTAIDPWHLYANTGTYYVCLTVTDSTAGGTCTDTWCDSVNVFNTPPLCNAEFAHYSIANPDSVHFYPTGSAATTYSWDFGDGTTSTLQYPWHEYSGLGTYYVCLTVTNSNSAGTCTDTWCDSVIVSNTPPVCNAEFSHYSVSNPDSVHFYPQSTSANTYFWDFGDGTTSTNHDPWHLYANNGTYYVCLTVTDSTSGGTCTATWCDSVIVSNTPPVCNAEFSHYSVSNPDSVHFYPQSISANTYFWDFGDGSTSTNHDPWHLYANNGTYYVCLTVTDSTSGGTCTATWCDSVHVGPTPPICNAEFAHYCMSNPDSVHFYPYTTSANTYSWDFGDGTTSTNHDPWHLFAGNGTYTVCLTVTDSTAGGTCTDTWCDSVNAGNTPVMSAKFSYYVNPDADSVLFVAPSNPTGATFLWDFGDGTTSTAPLQWHPYTSPGTYYVCLTVTDPTGTVTWCDSIHVNGVTGVPDIAASASTIKIYPNPMNEYATVMMMNYTNAVSFRVYDLTGRIVLQRDNLRSGSFNISGDELVKGIYYYTVIDGNRTKASGRLVVIH